METKTQIAIKNSRTLFPNKVKSVQDGLGKTELVIKKSSNGKLGKKILKGKWSGMPIYTVTLEERATCRKTCEHWSNCYGNSMPFATRYRADQALIPRMWEELTALSKKHKDGFAIRLHVLGDFYSLDYVGLWKTSLETFKNLHIWGYTERNGDDIAKELKSVREKYSERFKIRISGHTGEFNGALSYDNKNAKELLKRKKAFICPEQEGKTRGCDTCAACWQSDKTVIFLTH